MMNTEKLDYWVAQSIRTNEMTQAEVSEMRDFFLDLKAFCQGKSDMCRRQINSLKDREIAELRVKISQQQ
jgi:predicted RNA-binding protein associated with RNAse of E/G family